MTPPLLIAFDARSLRGERTGVGNYLSNLLEQLLSIDRAVEPLLVSDGPLPPFPWLDRERVRVERTSLRIDDNLLWTNLALRRKLSSGGAALFHSPGYTAPLGATIPTIVTLHDVSYASHPEWYPHAGGWLRRLWYRASARGADRVLTDSEFSRREIVRVYGCKPERVRRIYLGVDRRRFRPLDDRAALEALRGRYRLPSDFVLFVGDVHPRRNLKQIAEAVARLRGSPQAPGELELVVVGRVLDRAALPEGAPGVRILGYVPDGDLPLFYNAARAFVFPSSYEGFGLGVLEAMASGCPVVVGRGTACEEVAAEACIAVE
ncbi:MAG TPA: glycosyltransferase family 1 protein, partial [Candidatus Eisenbacteria bacterium]